MAVNQLPSGSALVALAALLVFLSIQPTAAQDVAFINGQPDATFGAVMNVNEYSPALLGSCSTGGQGAWSTPDPTCSVANVTLQEDGYSKALRFYCTSHGVKMAVYTCPGGSSLSVRNLVIGPSSDAVITNPPGSGNYPLLSPLYITGSCKTAGTERWSFLSDVTFDDFAFNNNYAYYDRNKCELQKAADAQGKAVPVLRCDEPRNVQLKLGCPDDYTYAELNITFTTGQASFTSPTFDQVFKTTDVIPVAPVCTGATAPNPPLPVDCVLNYTNTAEFGIQCATEGMHLLNLTCLDGSKAFARFWVVSPLATAPVIIYPTKNTMAWNEGADELENTGDFRAKGVCLDPSATGTWDVGHNPAPYWLQRHRYWTRGGYSWATFFVASGGLDYPLPGVLPPSVRFSCSDGSFAEVPLQVYDSDVSIDIETPSATSSGSLTISTNTVTVPVTGKVSIPSIASADQFTVTVYCGAAPDATLSYPPVVMVPVVPVPDVRPSLVWTAQCSYLSFGAKSITASAVHAEGYKYEDSAAFEVNPPASTAPPPSPTPTPPSGGASINRQANMGLVTGLAGAVSLAAVLLML